MILDLIQRESNPEERSNNWSASLPTTEHGYLSHPYPYNQPSEAHTTETTLAAYEQAIQLAPREAILYYHKARALEELGRTTEAQLFYQEARRLGYTS